MSSDVILRNASVPAALLAGPARFGGRAGQDLLSGDLLLRDGMAAGFLSGKAPEGARVLELEGQIILPRLAEAHCHLDKCHSIFRLDGAGGDLKAAIAAQGADRARATAADIRRRAEKGLAELHAAGCALVRSHIDWDSEKVPPGEAPLAWRVLGELADDWAGRLTLQRAALLSLNDFDRKDYCEAVARRLARDGGVLGVFVLDQARKAERLGQVFALAERFGLALDFHVDEGLAAGPEGLDLIAGLILERDFQAPVLCGHACALMNAAGGELDRLLEKVAAAGLSIVALPGTNLYLQGREAGATPERRGITRLRELRAAGVALAVGSDNVGDAFCPLGVHDPLANLGLAALVAHLDPPYGPWLTSVTTDARRALGFAAIHIDQAAVGDLLCCAATHSTGILAGARRHPLTDLLYARGGCLMSISGKNDTDWPAFAAALGDIAVVDKGPLVKIKSRDFFWYSPVLKRRLSGCYGDLVARPKTEAELRRVMAQAYAWKVPVTLRGGGTGNYGQAVPLDGGLIVEMTGLEEILEIGPDFVKVEAGCNIHRLNEALRAAGRELPIWPSTERMATIGGFIGGGSGGIGSVEHGMLRDRGNIVDLTVLTMEAEPRRLVLSGDEINRVHHAWGINGVIAATTLKTVPARDWINCIASFEDYRAAFEAGLLLSDRDDLQRKLVTTVDARIAAYFDKLEDRLGAPRDLLLALIAREDVEAFAKLAAAAGGRMDLALNDADMAAAGLPGVAEFSFNHTTLLVLKEDKTVTYLQVRVPAPIDGGKVAELAAHFGDEVLMHHEFIRLGGELVAIDLPIIRYSSDARLYAIIRTYEDWGFPVSDPHTCIIEDGGMKHADYRHLATKKRFDPLGLLNSGKSREWARVKDMTPEEIEALRAPEGKT